MATWNYRIVKRLGHEDWWSLHEVYYNKAGEATMMTVEPITFVAETKGDLIRALEMALSDCINREPFLEPMEWAECDGEEMERTQIVARETEPIPTPEESGGC